MTGQLDPRLRAVIDKDEIREVVYRFARGVDRHDWELVRSCFHEEATSVAEGIFEGDASEYLDFVSVNIPNFAEVTVHHITTVLVELDGDVAFSESYVIAPHRYKREDGTRADFVCHARYVDRFERRDGVWRIAKRQVVWDLVRDDAIELEFEGVGLDPGPLKWSEHGLGDAAYTFGREPGAPLTGVRLAVAGGSGDEKGRSDEDS